MTWSEAKEAFEKELGLMRGKPGSWRNQQSKRLKKAERFLESLGVFNLPKLVRFFQGQQCDEVNDLLSEFTPEVSMDDSTEHLAPFSQVGC